MKRLIVVIALIALTGCSFQVGIDWNGQTAKDNRTFTAKHSEKVEKDKW